MSKTQKHLTIALWALAGLSVVTGLVAVLLARGGRSESMQGVVAVVDNSGTAQQDGSLPVLFSAPSFKLIDQNGQPFTNEQLRGCPYVAAFVFTHCAGPCPMMFGKLARMQQTIPDPDVRLVTFTVDPERDTPAVLKQKLADLNADERRWTFLTGDKQSIDAVARGMLQPKPQGDDSPLLHSENFLLFDDENRCRGIYYSQDDAAMAKLKTDAELLASFARKANLGTDNRGAARDAARSAARGGS